MRYSKVGLRALGLMVLGALGMTFLAASAQATSLPGLSTPGSFQVDLVAASPAAIAGTQEGAGRLLVQGRNLTIECAGGAVLTPESKLISSTLAEAEFLSSGCVAWNFAQTTKLPCTVLTPGEPTGSVFATGSALPILHGGVNYVLFEPLTPGAYFAELELHGATCPLPLVNPIKGSLTAEVTNNDSVTPLITFSPSIQLLTGDQLVFAGFNSYIDASVKVEVAGGTKQLRVV